MDCVLKFYVNFDIFKLIFNTFEWILTFSYEFDTDLTIFEIKQQQHSNSGRGLLEQKKSQFAIVVIKFHTYFSGKLLI